MSAVLPASTTWRGDKIVAVTGHTRHRHNPSPISPGFKAPNADTTLIFGPSALAGSIARTATLRNAPPEMLVRWADSALTEVEWLVDVGTTFALSQYVHSLADAERTSFAGRVGAGITDLLMNALGYIWRDNASCLSGSLAPHADFIYAGGAALKHGVVLAEARGSFAANVTAASIGAKAKRKYLRQVKPHLAVISPHGKVVHGYSVGFASKPGTAGAFLHVAETRISKPRRRGISPTDPNPTPGDETVPTSLALSAHRANFALMNAPSVVRWIDWVRYGSEPPSDIPLSFIQVPYAGRTFLACTEFGWPFDVYSDWWDGPWHPSWRPPFWWRFGLRRRGGAFAGWFVMEEKAAERFLNALSEIIRNGRETIPDSLELPRIDPIGFGLGSEEAGSTLRRADYAYALYRDGLALLGVPPPRRIVGQRAWVPKDGMQAN